jgi:hypothetical protein
MCQKCQKCFCVIQLRPKLFSVFFVTKVCMHIYLHKLTESMFSYPVRHAKLKIIENKP